MTPISKQQPREPDAQAAAATEHDAPVPDDEAATVDANNADQEQQQVAKRERADFLAGIRMLIKSFKSLSHIFEIYKEDDKDEDMDTSIEIGFPTDVQHVAHIGLDGSTNVSSLRGLEGARELLSLSNLTTLEQFELAMASLGAPSNEHNEVLDRVSPN